MRARRKVADDGRLPQSLPKRYRLQQVRTVGSLPTLENGPPEAAAMNAAVLDSLDGIIEPYLGSGPNHCFPGAVALVARRALVVKFSAYGFAQTHSGKHKLDAPRPVRTDTVFDLGSITKVAATTLACMRLVYEGRLELDAPVSTWIPELSGDRKKQITIRQLLAHRSGLWEWQPIYLSARNQDEAREYITSLDLRYPVGQERHYSDLGFILLGEVVCRVTNEALDSYVDRAVHQPLGMTDTCYRPPAALQNRIAATSMGNPFEYRMISTGEPYPVEGDPSEFTGWRDYTLVGEANDGNASYCFAGVAGHAGLFSTARDLAILGQFLLNGGGYGAARMCSPAVVNEFASDQYDYGQGLGFLTRRPSSSDGSRIHGFGHGGFTGTELLIDPDQELLIILLTNRQHPDLPYASIERTWRTIVQRVFAAIEA